MSYFPGISLCLQFALQRCVSFTQATPGILFIHSAQAALVVAHGGRAKRCRDRLSFERACQWRLYLHNQNALSIMKMWILLINTTCNLFAWAWLTCGLLTSQYQSARRYHVAAKEQLLGLNYFSDSTSSRCLQTDISNDELRLKNSPNYLSLFNPWNAPSTLRAVLL